MRRLQGPLVPLAHDLQLLDGDLAIAGVATWAFDRARPRVVELPLCRFLTLDVVHGEGAVLPGRFHVPLLDECSPRPEVEIVGNTLLQGDRVPFQQARLVLDDLFTVWPAGFVFRELVLAADV